ncbi:MAG: hypothetical protein J6B04_06235 [Clostridia bacterium]|nr:hypothetical protein [Clostridia bacterium]
MQQHKSDSEIIAEIYRNAQLAIASISYILPEIEDADIKGEVLSEHEEYERIAAAAATLAKKYGLEIKDANPVKKAMMWGAIKMNTATDKSKRNVAEMMIKGTVNGITCLKASLTDGGENIDEEVKSLLKELITLEEGYEKRLKKFI